MYKGFPVNKTVFLRNHTSKNYVEFEERRNSFFDGSHNLFNLSSPKVEPGSIKINSKAIKKYKIKF